jgi:hypothetical protein
MYLRMPAVSGSFSAQEETASDRDDIYRSSEENDVRAGWEIEGVAHAEAERGKEHA